MPSAGLARGSAQRSARGSAQRSARGSTGCRLTCRAGDPRQQRRLGQARCPQGHAAARDGARLEVERHGTRGGLGPGRLPDHRHPVVRRVDGALQPGQRVRGAERLLRRAVHGHREAAVDQDAQRRTGADHQGEGRDLLGLGLGEHPRGVPQASAAGRVRGVPVQLQQLGGPLGLARTDRRDHEQGVAVPVHHTRPGVDLDPAPPGWRRARVAVRVLGRGHAVSPSRRGAGGAGDGRGAPGQGGAVVASARSRLTAALIRARWVKACGKLPSASPDEPISSAYRPRWLA